MQSRVTSWETDGKTERTQEVDAEIAKPDRMWAKILKGSDGATVGTQVLWNGDTTCRIQTKFFGFPLKLTMPIADSRLKSLRGWTLADVSVARFFKALLADKAPIRYVGQAMFGEQQVDVLELVTPEVVPGITKEHIGVSLDHQSMLVREFYVGDTVVSRSHYSQQAYNIALPPEHWNF
ncbi:MAG: hypothetical protein H7338_21600 [Candidatus Sericytochromatia bacterium]|nr:hypothetical protein [Candidatus Sericytochromatia bacterium]